MEFDLTRVLIEKLLKDQFYIDRHIEIIRYFYSNFKGKKLLEKCSDIHFNTKDTHVGVNIDSVSYDENEKKHTRIKYTKRTLTGIITFNIVRIRLTGDLQSNIDKLYEIFVLPYVSKKKNDEDIDERLDYIINNCESIDVLNIPVFKKLMVIS